MAGLVPAIHDFVGAMQPLQCLREAYSLVLQRQRLSPIRQHLTAGPCIVATGTRAPTARLAAETPQLKQLRRALQVRLGRHDPLRGASCVRALHLYLALPARVMARRKARSFYGDTSVSERAGTFRRAVKRRLCDAGPRFQVCVLRSSRPKAGSANQKLSASSWQGLVLVPGGAPAPPECRTARSARGQPVQLRRNASRSDPWRTRPRAG